MLRFTRSAGILLLAVGLAACSSPAPSGVRLSGLFGPAQPVILDNLTVSDGRYDVSVELDLVVRFTGPPVELSCLVVDTSARFGPFFGGVVDAASGRPLDLGMQATVELPDTTLGLRCFPDRLVVLEVEVEHVSLEADRAG